MDAKDETLAEHSEFDSLMTKEDYDRFVGEESEKEDENEEG